MKKIKILALIGLIAGSLAVLSACGQAIGTPDSDKFKVDKTNKLSWTAVSGARSYIIRITDVDTGEVKEVNAKRTSYSLSSLEEGDYEIQIKAIAGDKDRENSKWSGICYFNKAYESGCIYRLVNNMEYEITDVGSASGEVLIESTYRDKPVTSIADSAFRASKELTSIVIGDGITYIGRSTFNNCPNLASVTLPATLKTLGKSAFQGCRSLKTITIPDSLTTIPEYAFAYCRGLESVQMSNNATGIEQYAFAECSALLEAIIPDSVKSIGSRAFLGNEALASVKVGKGVENIEEYAFSGCKTLKKVEFAVDSALKTLGEESFYSCMELTDIVLPEGLQEIGVKTFNLCTSLEEISIPDTVTRIRSDAFISTKLFQDAIDKAQPFVYTDNWLIGCNVKNQVIVDDEGIERGWTVKADSFDREIIGVADGVFAYSQTLEAATLPSTVKYLGGYAFYKASLLQTVNIASTKIKEIGEYAFAYCPWLKTVRMKNVDGSSPVEAIGSYAFIGCSALSNSNLGGGSSMIPDSVTSIGQRAFHKTGFWETPEDGVVYAGNWVIGFSDETMTEIAIRPGTVGIADYSFYKYEKLKTVSGLSEVSYVGAGAFANCGSLERVILNTDLKVIKYNTFKNCVSLFDVALPARLTKIEKWAFMGCEKLNAIDFSPTRLTSIELRAFYRCTNLEKVTFSKELESIGEDAFYKCSMLKEVHIPDTVTEMGKRAFGGCDMLAKVTIGTGLTEISEGAFRNAKALKEVSIPENIQSIGNYAFYKCENIEKVTMAEGIETIGDYAFYGLEKMQRLTLPNSVKGIGMYAFKGCSILQSVVLGDNLETMGKYAFHGCKQMTAYTTAQSLPSGWHARWNSSYRPVIWGCVLSEDGSYVVSVTIGEDTVYNKKTENVIVSPKRVGYTFAGWTAMVDGVEVTYSANEIGSAPIGTQLTAVWVEGDEPLIQPPVEEDATDSSSESSSAENSSAESFAA